MKKVLFMAFVLMTTVALAQNKEKNPKDLWTSSVDVTLGDDWRQKNITVPGKGTPNVVDFYCAFAEAYPCEYYNLLTQALDGDEEVLFCHERPRIRIYQDSCLMENESFAMRVFYENDKPVALGVCCHKAITTKLQDAYYYRYNSKTRKLTPLAQGSDFTGGILKRSTSFSYQKEENTATMSHVWGRCGVESQLVWNNGKFVLTDPSRENFQLQDFEDVTMSVLDYVLGCHKMELREPEHNVDPNLEGGSYNSLPICVAIRDERSKENFAAATAMEGFYKFYARGWKKNDGSTLVAVYTRCAPEFDYHKQKNEAGEYITVKHQLEPGDEVYLDFYLCDSKGRVTYMDPASPKFATTVGKGMPDLKHNEWSCEISPDHEDLVFVNEADGQRKVFRWNGKIIIFAPK